MNWPPPKSSRRTFLAHGAAALALARTRAALGEPYSDLALLPTPLGSIRVAGDLGQRMEQNFTRLQTDLYRPPQIFRGTNWKSWPGDMEGRALLAVTLLSRATGKQPDYFSAMIAAYPAQLNPQGFFGPLLDLHAIHEQQLSGHGWYLRGLCEYYDWKHDSATLDQVRTIVRNLALPLRGKYSAYPIDPAVRAAATAPANPGAVDGHLAGRHGDWAISSDTCCAFIFLDGLAHAWVVLRAAGAPEAPDLKALIDEAIARFVLVDLVGIQAQTHASLTGMRALLRVYAETNDRALLAIVCNRYDLYKRTAMTETYANTNWFGRPNSWTEPCAIIDSFMVATQLWQHTGDPAYLEDAHHIWFNAVGRGLRSNGGFGTDTCTGYHTDFVRVRSYEAYFCCTMRGGEAHARAAQYLYFTREGELTIPFFSNSEATVDVGTPAKPRPITLRQTTGYPYSTAVRIEVIAAGPVHTLLTLRIFAPSWTQNAATLRYLKVNGNPVQWSLHNGFQTTRLSPRTGDILEFGAMVNVGPRPALNPTTAPGSYVFLNGPLILGYTPPADPAATLRSPDPVAVPFPRSSVGGPFRPGQDAVADGDWSGQPLPPGAVRYVTPKGGILLAPINDLHTHPDPDADPCPRQILFRES